MVCVDCVTCTFMSGFQPPERRAVPRRPSVGGRLHERVAGRPRVEAVRRFLSGDHEPCVPADGQTYLGLELQRRETVVAEFLGRDGGRRAERVPGSGLDLVVGREIESDGTRRRSDDVEGERDAVDRARSVRG